MLKLAKTICELYHSNLNYSMKHCILRTVFCIWRKTDIIVVYIMQSFALMKKRTALFIQKSSRFFDSELRFQHFLSALHGTFGNVFPHHNAC